MVNVLGKCVAQSSINMEFSFKKFWVDNRNLSKLSDFPLTSIMLFAGNYQKGQMLISGHDNKV